MNVLKIVYSSLRFILFFREVYLDGNELRCSGACDLIREIALHAEEVEIQKQIEAEKKLEEAKRLAEGFKTNLIENQLKYYFNFEWFVEEANKKPWDASATPVTPAEENGEKDEKGKKKKKKKKKGNNNRKMFTWIREIKLNFVLKGKKKKTKEPPPIGPFVYKLHLADNAIDMYENGANKVDSFATIHQTIELFTK